MYKVKYFGIAKGGKVHLEPQYFKAYNAAIFRLEGQEVEITIARKSKANTRAEQRYFRAVVVRMIAQEIGESEQKAFEIIQAQFFTEKDTHGRSYVRSTALGEWTTVEWEAKMEDIRRWALDFLNLKIPLPNQIEY
jgi:hypothetical protein